MIRLYYYPGNASMTPHILLHELGTPFELELVDRSRAVQRSAEYLRLNPNGLIPVLVDADLVLYETAAIVLHLVDTHRDAGLAPALGSVERAHFYKWLVWLTNTLQATLMVHTYAERWVDDGDDAAANSVRRQSQRRVCDLLDQLETQLQAPEHTWLLGPQFSAVDPFLFMLCAWTRRFDPTISAPAHARPALGQYMQRMLARPSVQRVLADEKLNARSV